MWHLYCLMDNHYHMGLVTPEANLSQIMHFINSAYAIYLNTKNERCGHLFQGRFKAILVQADTYARTLTKYIHANPVKKGIVERPEDYEWSSCQGYFGLLKTPSWLDTRTIMACFGGSIEVLRREHDKYISSPEDLSFHEHLRRSSRIGILGDDDFVDKIRRPYLRDLLETNAHGPGGLRKLQTRPELSRISEEFRRELGDKNKLAKKCTIFFAHQYAAYKLKEIGNFLGIGSAAVSMAFRKVDKDIQSNEALSRAIERIRDRLAVETSSQKKN